MIRILGVLRRPDGLAALVSQEREPAAGAPPAFAVLNEPLTNVASAVLPRRDELLSAWAALAAVSDPDATTLRHVLTVLVETVALEPERWHALPPLRPVRLDPIRRATAAHPRAFQGTTDRPPKRPSPKTIDLRPYLRDRKGTRDLLSLLAPHWPAGIEHLTAAGYDVSSLRALGDDAVPVDPYLAVHHRHRVAPGGINSPTWFSTDLLPSLRGLDWDEVRSFEALGWALNLDRDANLRAVVARLLCQSSIPLARGWLEHALRVPVEGRQGFLTHLLVSGADALNPASVAPEHLTSFLDAVPDERFDAWLARLLAGLVAGEPADYLVAGFRLAAVHRPDHGFGHGTRPGARHPAAAIRWLMAHLEPVLSERPELPFEIWRRCGELPALAGIVEDAEWSTLPPRDTLALLDLYLDLPRSLDPSSALDAKGAAVAAQVSIVVRALAAVAPDYRAKFVDHLDDLYQRWDKPAQLRESIPDALLLLQRLAAPPFQTRCTTGEQIARLLERAAEPARIRLLAAPDRSLRKLETACRHGNTAALIRDGLDGLCQRLPAFAIDAFLQEPTALLPTARLLGGLNAELRAEAVRAFANASSTDDIVPMRDRLARLQEHALRVAAGGLPADPTRDDLRHALLIRHHVEENRAAFRRFLRAHLNGGDDYLLDHPRTRDWLARHPRLSFDLWQRGVLLVDETPEFGSVRLAVEQNPLETLRLGSYVGSCLGLGGVLSYSAAAVVLDVNKRVVYARNRRGSVVGRQLLAIAEDDRLVCFEVYPYEASQTLRALFQTYDLAFAAALGLPLLPAPNADYEIASILSHGWWDDGPWHPIRIAPSDHSPAVQNTPRGPLDRSEHMD